MPGLSLALLCCSSLTCFDWLREFRRNLRILDYGEKCRIVKDILNFLETAVSVPIVHIKKL